MAPKKKKGGAKTADDDDWDAILKAEATVNPPEAPAAKTPAPVEEAAAPVVTEEKVDAAAAFLASMGGGPAGGGGADKKKKEKKKGKPVKKEEEAAAAKPKEKPLSAAGKLVAERLAKQRAEEERLRVAREAEEARIAAEEERLAKEEREAEEARQEKLKKRAEKKEEQRKAGTYETKKQKEQRLAAERRLAGMKAAGMVPGLEQPAAASKKSATTAATHKKKMPAPHKPAAPEKVEEVVVEPPTPPREEEEEEEEAALSWEEKVAGDDWEAMGEADDGSGPVFKLRRDSAEDDVDLAEQERLAELEELKKKGLEQKRRDEEKKAEQERLDRMETEAAEMEDKLKRDREVKKLDARARRQAREKTNLEQRTTARLRTPICCIMGHVDTGKTKLLDKIRQTNVQDGEAGGITQQIGATFFDQKTLREKIAPVPAWLAANVPAEKKLSAVDSIIARDAANMILPGLMVIDTPGHEAFSNLRSRGSSLCDMAILVIDLMHGLEPQTLESISMLKRKKTPFVIALNKMDRCYDWDAKPGSSSREALKRQKANTTQEFDQRLAQITGELNAQSLNVALYWENEDPGSYVSVVPTSAVTGEGVSDLLDVVLALTQRRLSERLMWCATLQCTVLEVKVVEGLGSTLDVILVNGVLHEGDTIVVCTQDGPLVTQARALLTPPPMREMRVKSDLVRHQRIEAAIGLKITGPDLEKVVAGTGIMVCGPDDDLEDLKEEVMKDFGGLAGTLVTEARGVSVQASTLGALEALLEFLKAPGKDRHGVERPPIPVASYAIGPIYKKDVLRASLMAQKGFEEFACILGFDVAVDPDARAFADLNRVKIFTADIIYHLEQPFTNHYDSIMEVRRDEAKGVAVFPCVVKLQHKHVFNAKDPIVVGCEVTDGVLKVGTPLCIPHNGFLEVGIVQSIESNHKSVDKARKGTECAIKIVNASNPTLTYGRQFDATHPLYSKLNRASIDALKKYFKAEMTDDDWRLVIKLKKVYSII